MRIIKRIRVNADEDDVQIIYESPADEDCQFIAERVVNPPSVQLTVHSKASCSRTSVIAGRKRPSADPLPSPRQTGFKQQILQANCAESLAQPTTSQQSDESSIQDSSLRQQQPSNSGQTTAEQLPLGPYRQDSNSATTAAWTVNPICILKPSGGKPIRILSENEKRSGSSGSSSLGKINFQRKEIAEAQRMPKVVCIWQQGQPTVQIFQESNNVTSDEISPAGTINQQEELEITDSQRTQEQTVSTATHPSNPTLEETSVESDDNIPSPAVVNQQIAFKHCNPQHQATITHSNFRAIPSTSTASDNISSVALENQQQHALEQYSQEAEERSLNMIAPRNMHAIQESSNLAGDDNNYSRVFVSNLQDIFEQHDSQDTPQQAMSTTTQSSSLEQELSMASEDISSDEEEYINEKYRYFADCIYRRRLSLKAQIKEHQAMILTTRPNIHAIRESTNVTNDHGIHSQALINQQQETFEQHNSQETQQQAISSTTQPNIQENINVASDNDNSSEELVNRQLIDFPLVNQQQQTLEQNSQETEQQTVSMTTQPNFHGIQESINVVNNHNVPSQALMNQQGPIEQYNSQETERQATRSTTQPNINIIQKGIVTRNTGQLRTLQLPNLRRQTTGPIPIVQVKNETSGNNSVLQNQTSQATRPLDLTQTGDLLEPTLQPGIIAIRSSYLTKEKHHLVWKGTIECRKKINESFVSLSVPLRCSIYGIKTTNGNMNVNADLWPSQMTLLLLPRHILLKLDLFKELNSVNRHATINFDVESEFVNVLRKGMSSGWMGYIQFPRHKDMMIVLYMPHKQLYIGFITNNESGFITKFTHVCREFDMEEQQKYQPAINTFETIDKDIDAYISLLRLQQQFLSLGSHQVQARPQQTSFPLSAHQASLPPSQQTSLPLPAHQQSSLSPNPHQYVTLPLASHQQTSLPLAAHQQTSLPLTSHQQTSLPQCSHQQSSLPQCSHQQTSFPQCSHQQTSFPQCSHQQTGLPQSSHLQASLPQSSHQQTSLPQSSRRLMNLFQLADSLQEKVIANKYETVDRHIDACISALHQRNQSSPDAGPSTSNQALTPIQTRRLHWEQLLREIRQGSGTSNESLLQTSGASNSQTTNLSQEPPPVNPKQVESQASEIFHPSLVKKVARKRLKTTGKSFKSVHELCEAILEYEESKRKNKEAKKSKREVTEALLCKICMDEQMNVVFEPCGHLSTCLECSQPLEKCPMCRTQITNKRKIYMS